MDVNYVNPFIESVENAFETMVGVKAEREEIFLKGDTLTSGDITGVIGFAEKNLTGSVSLSFASSTALFVYNTMTGENLTTLSRNVQDLIGELTNIVAGGAKTIMARDGMSFHISIPSVVVGKHKISHKGAMPVLAVPFRVEKRRFILEVTMQFLNPSARSA